MPSLIEIIEKTPIPDVTVQSALREIDTGQLAAAMHGYDEDEQQAVYRNMSKRAAALLKEEVDATRDKTPAYAIREAAELFKQKLTKYARHYAEDDKHSEVIRLKYAARERNEEAPRRPQPVFDMASGETIFESFKDLKLYIQAEGILALEGAEEKVDNPVVKKALQLLVDGWDPMVMRIILDRMSQSYLDKQKRQLDMILDGMECLASSEHLIGIEERLKAHMV